MPHVCGGWTGPARIAGCADCLRQDHESQGDIVTRGVDEFTPKHQRWRRILGKLAALENIEKDRLGRLAW